jgi:hypothetical protein
LIAQCCLCRINSISAQYGPSNQNTQIVPDLIAILFQNQGRKYDSAGNLRDWWAGNDGAEYEKRAAVMIRQAEKFEVHGLKLNGKLTCGENIADLGGVKLSLRALQRHLRAQEEATGKPAPLINGFTPEQRLFLAWSQAWRENGENMSLASVTSGLLERSTRYILDGLPLPSLISVFCSALIAVIFLPFAPLMCAPCSEEGARAAAGDAGPARPQRDALQRHAQQRPRVLAGERGRQDDEWTLHSSVGAGSMDLGWILTYRDADAISTCLCRRSAWWRATPCTSLPTSAWTSGRLRLRWCCEESLLGMQEPVIFIK